MERLSGDYLSVYTSALNYLNIPKEQHKQYISYDCEGGVGQWDPRVIQLSIKYCVKKTKDILKSSALKFDIGLPITPTWANDPKADGFMGVYVPLLVDDYLINTLGLNTNDLFSAFMVERANLEPKQIHILALLMEEIYGMVTTRFTVLTEKEMKSTGRIIRLFGEVFRRNLKKKNLSPYKERKGLLGQQLNVLSFLILYLQANPTVSDIRLLKLTGQELSK